MEAIIDAANDQDVQLDAVRRKQQHRAGRGGGPPGQELRPDPGQRPGRRPGEPENVALGWQYVDVWKNSNELGKAGGEAALQLCAGTAIADVTLPRRRTHRSSSVAPDSLTPTDFTTPGLDGEPDSGDETSSSPASYSSRPRSTAETLNLPLGPRLGTRPRRTSAREATADSPGAAVCEPVTSPSRSEPDGALRVRTSAAAGTWNRSGLIVRTRADAAAPAPASGSDAARERHVAAPSAGGHPRSTCVCSGCWSRGRDPRRLPHQSGGTFIGRRTSSPWRSRRRRSGSWPPAWS